MKHVRERASAATGGALTWAIVVSTAAACGTTVWSFDEVVPVTDAGPANDASLASTDAPIADVDASGASDGARETGAAADASPAEASPPEASPPEASPAEASPPEASPPEASPAEASSDAGPVPCASDTDCPISALHYNIVTGACVPCVDSSQCATSAAPVCDSSSNRCVACVVATDCAADQTCEVVTHQCIPTCGGNTTCPAGTHCNDAGTTCVVCGVDADCTAMVSGGTALPVCDTATGQCGQCVLDSQCSTALPICDRTKDRCVRCATSADCPEESICSPTSQTCIASDG